MQHPATCVTVGGLRCKLLVRSTHLKHSTVTEVDHMCTVSDVDLPLKHGTVSEVWDVIYLKHMYRVRDVDLHLKHGIVSEM